MDFETEQHFLFPNSNSKEVDTYATILNKTSRDQYFYYTDEDEYSYGDTKWK